MTHKIYWVFLLLVLTCLGGCGGGLKVKSYAPTPERGDVISGRIVKPEGDGPFPGVIILHGCSGVNDLDYSWARRLKDWGYASLVLDSHGPRAIFNNCTKRKITKLERALDAHAAKVQFGELPFVDRNRIGVIGFSEGGGTILEAIRPNLVKYSLPEGSRDPFKAAVAFYPHCYGAGDSNTNLMILIGEKDDWTPAQLCMDNLPTAVKPEDEVLIEIYPGAYHSFDYQKPLRDYLGYRLGYDSNAMADAVPRTKAFLDKHLKYE